MMNSRLAGSALVHQLAPRLFSTSAVARATAAAGPANALLAGSLGISPSRVPAEWLRVLHVRLASTAPAVGGDEDTAAKDAASLPASERTQIESYWGIPPSKLAKEDGTEWRWSCFKPWDTYKPDISIDLKKHHVPTTFLDKPAFRTVKALPIPTHIFFQIWGYGHNSPCRSYKPPHAILQTFPRCFCVKAQGGAGKDQAGNVHSQLSHSVEKDNMGLMPDRRSDGEEGKRQAVISFSPLEARISGLRNESLKIKRTELSQKLTYALIPALLFISKTKLTTSLLILSVYWQIYGFFKEIFLDYVHQEVTRKWALIYFKLLLIILAKDTLIDFDLV